jgi:hypothetical protein
MTCKTAWRIGLGTLALVSLLVTGGCDESVTREEALARCEQANDYYGECGGPFAGAFDCVPALDVDCRGVPGCLACRADCFLETSCADIQSGRFDSPPYPCLDRCSATWES